MRVNSSQPVYAKVVAVMAILYLLTTCSGRDENGKRSVEKEVGELRFSVEYQPSASKAEDNENEIEYFKIKLEKTDDQDIVQYLSETSGLTKEEVLYYFSYRLKDDVFLEQEGEKKGSVLCHFERSFDLKSGRVFNVGFEPVSDKDKEVTLLIDSELLNVGPVKLKF